MECLQGKATRAASLTSTRRATKPLVNISVDLWGPATTRSRRGHYYFLTCYDDFSRYLFISPLKSKDETVVAALIKYSNLVENQLDRTIKTIRSDQGGEFSSNEFKRWCDLKGIEHVFTPTAADDQNSRVERVHLTLMNDVRTALIDSGLPKTFWADALAHSVYTRNRLPNSEGILPVKRFKADDEHHCMVDYRRMRAFGSSCVYRVVNQASKLDARARQGRVIGYGLGTSSYTILTEDYKVICSRGVIALYSRQSIRLRIQLCQCPQYLTRIMVTFRITWKLKKTSQHITTQNRILSCTIKSLSLSVHLKKYTPMNYDDQGDYKDYSLNSSFHWMELPKPHSTPLVLNTHSPRRHYQTLSHINRRMASVGNCDRGRNGENGQV